MEPKQRIEPSVGGRIIEACAIYLPGGLIRDGRREDGLKYVLIMRDHYSGI